MPFDFETDHSRFSTEAQALDSDFLQIGLGKFQPMFSTKNTRYRRRS